MKINAQIIENAKATKNKLDNHYQALRILQGKGQSIADSLPGLRANVEAAAERKEGVLDLFCLNECNEEKVTEAQIAHDEAVQKLKNAEELHRTINRKIADHDRSTMAVNENARMAKGKVWDEISNNLTADLKPLQQQIHTAYLANLKRTRGLLYQAFLLKAFPEPTPTAIDDLGPELEARYEKVIN